MTKGRFPCNDAAGDERPITETVDDGEEEVAGAVDSLPAGSYGKCGFGYDDYSGLGWNDRGWKVVVVVDTVLGPGHPEALKQAQQGGKWLYFVE